MPSKLLGVWLLLVGVAFAPARAADPPAIFVGGQFIRQTAIDDRRGHLLVPVRGVFEALHADVTYTAPRYVVVRKNGAIVAGLIVGRNDAVVGRHARMLPVAPVRRNGHVYVPLRSVAEIAGASVIYSAKPRLVDIRVPYNELAVAVPAAVVAALAPAPPDPPVPVWEYALAGFFLLAFLIELVRQLAPKFSSATSKKPVARAVPVDFLPLAPRALQLPHAADAGDEHRVGQVIK